MADRYRRVPRSSEVHIFEAEISRGEQIVPRAKPNDRAVIANSGHHSAIFWQLRSAVILPLSDTGSSDNFDLRNKSFF